MEDEAQKMVALKKAYADIILNTAKEAAARIMVSERKAVRFQQDLCASRDEALQMLIRLKQMLDSKTTEAELKSLSQQRRIDELESQLQEAEDVITDLRVELKSTEEELESAKINQAQAMNEKVAQERSISEKVSPFVSSGCETMETSKIKNIPTNQRVTDDNFCSTVKPTERQTESDLNRFYSGKSVLASIIMRNKNPELYRNGCTQRVRAFERNGLNGKLSPDEYEDGGNEVPEEEMCSFSLKSAIVEMDKNLSQGERKKPGKVCSFRRKKTRFGKAKNLRKCSHEHLLRSGQLCSPSSPDGRDSSDEGELILSLIESSDGMQENSRHDNGDEFKIINKGKRKRNIKGGNEDRSLLSPCGQLVQSCQPSSVLSRCRTFAYLVDGGLKSVEDQTKTQDNEVKAKPLPRLDPGLTSIKRDSDSVSVSADVQAVKKFKPVQDDAEKYAESVGERVLVKQGSSGSKLNGEITNVSFSDCEVVDNKASESLNELPSKEEKNRLLKYTFQRKRKKEATSSPDDFALPEKNTVTRKAAEEFTAPEPQKSSLMVESSRDSRRLAQGARQLISLSGRRWQ